MKQKILNTWFNLKLMWKLDNYLSQMIILIICMSIVFPIMSYVTGFYYFLLLILIAPIQLIYIYHIHYKPIIEQSIKEYNIKNKHFNTYNNFMKKSKQ